LFAAVVGIIRRVPKDRTRQLFVALDVLIVIERSSAHPVEYAEVKLIGGWGDIVRSWERTR
jgi:hypothetical protein